MVQSMTNLRKIQKTYSLPKEHQMTHLNKLSDDLFNSSNYLIDFLSNNLRPNGLGDMVIDDEFVDSYYLFLENLHESLMTYKHSREKYEKTL